MTMTTTHKSYRQMTITRARSKGWRVSTQWTAGELADLSGECFESYGHVNGVELFGTTTLRRAGDEVLQLDANGRIVARYAPDKTLRILVK